MGKSRQVYLLDPQQFSPETIAVAFAKTSRSPESFIQIASELNETKSAEFNEKWVVGYGHSSVAEHAVLHIAVENISRLATECLESNRLASYTEKSTRYQTWDADAFHIPEELNDSPLRTEYIQTCEFLLGIYESFIPTVIASLRKNTPRKEEESSSAWERRVRSIAIDNCRFLLPAAVLANVGMTINARALEHALVKMLSHPLAEVRRIGEEIKSAAMQSTPTLLKYANADNTLKKAEAGIDIPNLPSPHISHEWCKMIDFDDQVEDKILASYLYKLNDLNYTQCLDWVQSASLLDRAQLAHALLNSDDSHSIPLRELEHSSFTFDITLDQGGYYEVKRHRMMTLTAQPLTAELGYAIPRAISDAGLEEDYCVSMEKARQAYTRIVETLPQAASYVVPNAFNRRFLITTNYRSLVHFIQLRSAANAHFSVRRLAQEIADQMKLIMPTFTGYLHVNPDETVAMIEETCFTELMKNQ
jgi:thymidylate synthase ThyX